MTSTSSIQSTQASVAYAALRQSGAGPVRAREELGLPRMVGMRLERMFLNRQGPMRPKFARHAKHVSAVTAAGGYPVMPERRR